MFWIDGWPQTPQLQYVKSKYGNFKLPQATNRRKKQQLQNEQESNTVQKDIKANALRTLMILNVCDRLRL